MRVITLKTGRGDCEANVERERERERKGKLERKEGI